MRTVVERQFVFVGGCSRRRGKVTVREVPMPRDRDAFFLIEFHSPVGWFFKASVIMVSEALGGDEDYTERLGFARDAVQSMIDSFGSREMWEFADRSPLVLAISRAERRALQRWLSVGRRQVRGRELGPTFAVSVLGFQLIDRCLGLLMEYFEGDELHTVVGADRAEISGLRKRIIEIIASRPGVP